MAYPNGEGHDFYCIQCGRKGIPIFRKAGSERGRFHRKKMCCTQCRVDINHIEIRNDQEKEIFIAAFFNGDFAQEAIESKTYVQNERVYK
jgi:hypothetical protein